MKRVPPSEQIRQEWDQILCNGDGENEPPLDALARAGARYMPQVAIEQDVTAYLAGATTSGATVAVMATATATSQRSCLPVRELLNWRFPR